MTIRFRNIAALSLFLPIAAAHGASAPEPLGEPGCRIADIAPRPMGDAVSWSGACKDGHAEGKGVLSWRVAGEGKRTLEAMLVRGEISGEGTLTYEGGKYIGTFRQGMPHGAGYFRYPTGDRYEGGVVHGVREGAGVMIALDGSSYEGEWKAGRRHGSGKASFTLGGSYQGEWRNGKMHGKGTMVHTGSGRTFVGEFRNDRAVGAVPVPAGNYDEFGLNDDDPAFRALAQREAARRAPPKDANWIALTPDQKQVVRHAYPALDDRDEPPYPLKGMRPFHAEVSALYAKMPEYEGEGMVYVTVGADGVPTSATTYGVTHQEFGRYLSMVVMMQRFKPALCAGTPCAMIFPIRFSFALE